jgi:hypothetical protein
MRGTLRALGLVIAFLALGPGCHHDRYKIKPPVVEEYQIPPDEKRYNEPDTAPYKKPTPPKDEKSLIGKPGGMGGPGSPGGF